MRDGGGHLTLSERRAYCRGWMILKEQAPAGGGTLASSALVPSWEKKHLVPSPPTSAGPLSLFPPRLMILLPQGPEVG